MAEPTPACTLAKALSGSSGTGVGVVGSLDGEEGGFILKGHSLDMFFCGYVARYPRE